MLYIKAMALWLRHRSINHKFGKVRNQLCRLPVLTVSKSLILSSWQTFSAGTWGLRLQFKVRL